VSLSSELRDELAAVVPARECCRVAELSALFHTAGSIHLRGRGVVAVHLDLQTNAVARRAFALLRGHGGTEIRTYTRHAFDRATRYELHVPGETRVLQEAGVLNARHAPLDRPPKRVVGRACCRGAYLRGALLGGGSLSGPRAPHLEIRTAEVEGAQFLAELAPLRVLERRTHAVAYAKGAEAIEAVLAAAGAADVVLALEERSVVAATRANANRLANADHANLVRTTRAAADQLKAIRRLDLDALPDRLQEMARLRLNNPSASIRELAVKAQTTKASAQRRLKRLVELGSSRAWP
jgi:DNA-binding protein WhiA